MFLSIPEYIAVRTAVLFHLPVEGSTVGFVSSYGIGVGLTLDFLWTLLIFQAFLAVLVLTAAASSLIGKGWRWVYVFSALVLSGFLGFLVGVRLFLNLCLVL